MNMPNRASHHHAMRASRSGGVSAACSPASATFTGSGTAVMSGLQLVTVL